MIILVLSNLYHSSKGYCSAKRFYYLFFMSPNPAGSVTKAQEGVLARVSGVKMLDEVGSGLS